MSPRYGRSFQGITVKISADYGTLVSAIYDAAFDQDAWNKLPVVLSHAVNGESAVFGRVDIDGEMQVSVHNVDEDSMRLFRSHYRFVDPYAATVAKHAMFGVVHFGTDLISERDIRSMEFQEFLVKSDTAGPVLVAMLEHHGHVFSGIGIHRPKRFRAFRSFDRQLLQTLVPHIGQMFAVRRQLEQSRAQAEIVTTAIDAIQMGIMVCGKDGSVLYANSAAEALAGQTSGLFLRRLGQPISANRTDQTRKLLHLVGRAAGGQAGGGLRLNGSDGSRTFIVVSPLPAMLGRTRGRALVAFRSEGSPSYPSVEVLCDVFGFTRAEGQIAIDLIQSRTLIEIQTRRQVSENTIRTQMASMFSKAGVGSQRQLVNLLTLVPDQS